MFSKCFLVIVLKVAKSPECKNDVRAHAVVGQYSVSGGPLKGPGGPNGPPVCYLKYALLTDGLLSVVTTYLHWLRMVNRLDSNPSSTHE